MPWLLFGCLLLVIWFGLVWFGFDGSALCVPRQIGFGMVMRTEWEA
jgi:hypothetical protein